LNREFLSARFERFRDKNDVFFSRFDQFGAFASALFFDETGKGNRAIRVFVDVLRTHSKTHPGEPDPDFSFFAFHGFFEIKNDDADL